LLKAAAPAAAAFAYCWPNLGSKPAGMCPADRVRPRAGLKARRFDSRGNPEA